MKKSIDLLFKSHIIISMVIPATLFLLIYILKIPIDNIAKKGPITNGYALISSLLMLWFYTSVFLVFAKLKKITVHNILPIILCGIISLLYLTFLREHVKYGDLSDYLFAAENILKGEPFNQRYLYPPLWASFLAGVINFFGIPAAMLVIFFINQISISAFFILGVLFLKRYKISTNFSAILIFATMVVNTGIFRNVVYCQVNLLLVDLILTSLLLLNKNNFLSAFLFAFSIHLKVIPIFFIPLFLNKKNLKWILYLTITGISLATITIFFDGISYYFDFINNLTSWSPTPLRSSSIFSFIENTNLIFNIKLPTNFLWISFRITMLISIYYLAYLTSKNKNFSDKGIYNSIIPAFFIMITLSPTVWAHHLVILIIPSVLILLCLKTPKEFSIFSAGYFFSFIMPVFDIYPWSYLRFAGWIMLLGLTAYIIIKKQTFSDISKRIDNQLNTIVSYIYKQK